MERLVAYLISDDGLEQIVAERRLRIARRQVEIDATLRESRDAIDYLRTAVRLRELAEHA